MKTEVKHITQITEINASDLEQMLTSSVRAGLQKFKQELEQEKKEDENPDKLMNITEVCDFLKISKPTLHNYLNSGKLISYGVGQKRYFRYSEVLNALEKQNRKK